mmetsp:Transcript_48627/g.126147  ORF Transcript_48627/g.126147 Transcript_48627/m.126147 type:complete len:521 (-) Transcript_48627:3731-5293(-)
MDGNSTLPGELGPNVVLIIVVAITAALVYAVSWLFIIVMVHPDDKNQAWVSKIFTTLGLSLAAYIVLLLPLDVSTRSEGVFAPWPMETIWTIAYITAAVFCFVVIPFLVLAYETDEDSSPIRRFLLAIGWTFVALIVAAAIIAIMYFLLGFVEIPVETNFARFMAVSGNTTLVSECTTSTCTAAMNACKANATLCYPPPTSSATWCGFVDCGPSSGQIKLRMSVAVYIMAMISWFGSFFFAIFGGVGFVSLPYDLILGFVERPRRIDVKQFAKQKLEIKDEVTRLIGLGRDYEAENGGKKANKAKQRMFMNEFRARVYQLENHTMKLITAFKDKGGNPLKPFFSLVFGILAIILSLSWLGQIVLYMVVDPPVTDYMNIIFQEMNKVFSLLSTITVALFIFYLLWCVLKGQMKIGMRIFLVSIHPMAPHETMMNSLLFNTGLLLFCAVAVVQFATKAFSVYAVNTAASRLFGVQIENLMFLQYFYRYNVFTYMLVGFAFLTLIFGIFKTCCRYVSYFYFSV